MFFLNIKDVDFLVTYKCPAKCAHCSYKAGPHRTGVMSKLNINRYLNELTNDHLLQSITIHGGEPFLYQKEMKYILNMARACNIKRRGVITNGFWAETSEKAKKILNQMELAGLNRLTISVDAFHQRFISFKKVLTAIVASLDLGFERIWIDSYFLGEIDSTNEYNKFTNKLLGKLPVSEKIEINKRVMGFEGRGADLTNLIQSKKNIPSGNCPLPFWIGGDLNNPTTVEIDSLGNVTLCPGICIGNLTSRTLQDIIENYSSKNHPILSKLATEGPIGIYQMAKESGFGKNSFVDECHLCYESRRFLSDFFPDFLAPKICYE